MRRVVFNGDDLGMGAPANEGIAAAFEAGVVKEASLLVTFGAASEEGARVAKRTGGALGVGLHLCFTEGSSLTGPLRGLTGKDGRFRSLLGTIASCRAGIARSDELEREIRAQIDRVEELGFSLTHLNGHHHAHVFPMIRTAVLRVLADRPVPYLRVSRESPSTGGVASVERAVLARSSKSFLRAARKAGVTVRTLPFVGTSLYAKKDHRRRFDRILDRLGAPATEWMVHPSRGPANLAPELETLTSSSLRSRLDELGIVTARYDEIDSSDLVVFGLVRE